MSGLTIIHLSDLHIGKRQKNGWKPTKEERYPLEEKEILINEAERLVKDFIHLRNDAKIPVPFRTEEIVLLVTGDITHNCQWWQFELALWFFSKLQQIFEKCSGGDSILSSRILCIPGNHDIHIPFVDSDEPGIAETDKYRDFKLFFDIVTDYSPQSRDFKLSLDAAQQSKFLGWISPSPTNIYMTVAGPLKVCIVDLNSCMAINCLNKKDKHPGAKPGITSESLNYAAHLFESKSDAIRIAIMHHSIDDLEREEKRDLCIDRPFFENWIREHKIRLLLTGHTHMSEAGGITNAQGEHIFIKLTTGPTFPYAEDERKHKKDIYNYQIIRLDLNKSPLIYQREVHSTNCAIPWGIPTSNPNTQECCEIGLTWDQLTKGITPSISKNFIGCFDKDNWAVISHCESGKFQNYGILSPGETINAALIHNLGSSQGNLVKTIADFEVEYPPGTDKAGKWSTAASLFDKQCVFLVDSPRYNHYVNWVLENYGAHMAGARVEFRDNVSESPYQQEIIACGQVFKSERGNCSLFGKYEDYLLIMRLPGLVSASPDSVENRRCPDINKTIWIIAGIHSKASQAGAILFERKNLTFFLETLMARCGGEIPKYFEAVYKIPLQIERPFIDQKDLEFLNNPEHFRVLQIKTEIAMADAQPPGIAARFRQDANYAKIPLEIIHLDPVAACNYNCPKCIEKDLKKQNTYLSLPTCLKILCDLKAVGCSRVNLYGGEPTLYPHFSELLRTICAMGFETLIVTNGSKLSDPDIMKALIACRKNIQLRISLDACSNDTYNKSHGLKTQNGYDEIVLNTKNLIKEGVPTIISFLLYKHVLDEPNFKEVCQNWQKTEAKALILRPVTEKEGKNVFDYKKENINTINEILAWPGGHGFIQTFDWFAKRMQKTKPEKMEPPDPKEYKICYSAFYRMTISPYSEEKNEEIKEISTAFLSWCSYRRKTSEKVTYGIQYPKDLKKWLQEERFECLKNVNPSQHCKDIYCCRHDLNKELHKLLSIKH